MYLRWYTQRPSYSNVSSTCSLTQVEYHSQFQLYLHSKMANPHYKPELQALIIWLLLITPCLVTDLLHLFPPGTDDPHQLHSDQDRAGGPAPG